MGERPSGTYNESSFKEDPMRAPGKTQYNVEFPSDPVVSEKLNRLLSKMRVDLKSVVTTCVGARTLVQFLAPKSEALREELKKMGVSVREELIFQFEMPHHHWELHKLAKSLATEGINILSLYSNVEGEQMRIVLAVDQPANAMAIIEKLGFEPDYAIYD
jgi:hypothetical protein